MKRLLLTPLLLTLLLASCSTKKKYNSFREAVDACKKWADKGEFYIIKTKAKTLEEFGKRRIYSSLKYEVPFRSCEEEMQTKQVLGIEIINRNAKEVYNTDSHMSRKWGIYGKGFSDDKKEVKKNFYF
tara:strand:+ start:311 stop:694 length:384 start_codon:yes stop_codon:yes gene_type:complete